jgi:hypothetical protein
MAMAAIPTDRVKNRLRVFIATNKVGIKAQIYRLLTDICNSPAGARILKAVKAPNTAGAT